MKINILSAHYMCKSIFGKENSSLSLVFGIKIHAKRCFIKNKTSLIQKKTKSPTFLADIKLRMLSFALRNVNLRPTCENLLHVNNSIELF